MFTPAQFHACPSPVWFVLSYRAGAAVFRKGDDELREAFNAELATLLQDKEKWLELVEPYGFTEAEMPPPDLTAEQLCQG